MAIMYSGTGIENYYGEIGVVHNTDTGKYYMQLANYDGIAKKEISSELFEMIKAELAIGEEHEIIEESKYNIEVGDIVVCQKKNCCLTIGESYEVHDINNGFVYIEADDREYGYYDIKDFKPLIRL